MLKKIGIGCLGLLGLFVALGVIGSAVPPKGSTSTSPTPTSSPVAALTATARSATPTTAPTPSTPRPPTPTPAPTPFNFGTGKKLVGAEVPAGTYRMRTASPGCYWERLSGLGGTFGEIIANGNPSGPEVVTIAPGDKAFNSSRCASWSADVSAITKSQTAPFGAGTFMVGVDIAPGTWRSSQGDGCYWQRVKGFGGTFGDIIANENATGASTLVTIATSDKGFSNTRCGTWTKID